MPYYGYRHYKPDLGRWVNRDPIEEGVIIRRSYRAQIIYDLSRVEPNLYVIALNNAVCLQDYLGLAVTVENNSSCYVIAIPEDDGGFGQPNPPIPVPPDGTITTPIDGVISCCNLDSDCPIMKVVDGGGVRVGANGGFDAYPAIQ